MSVRLRSVFLALVVCTAALAAGAFGGRDTRSALGVGVVARGFVSPVLATSARRQPGVLYVVEQSGRIVRIAKGRRTVFLDLRGAVDSSSNERGLLGLAFHPRFPNDRRFFVAYTTQSQNVVAEFRANGAGTVGLPSTRRQFLAVNDPYSNHNGGNLAFGRDGYLYTTIGDGGSGGDPENRAQDPVSPFGKLLRFDVDRPAAGPEIVALGLRNAWRFTFDRANGNLYIGDVGQNAVEEVDFTPYPSPGVENYEWDVREGTHAFEDKAYGPGKRVDPIAEYTHSEGCSVTGGYVYRGTAVRSAVGRYFYGDYCSGRIWSLVVRDGKATGLRREPFSVEELTSFGESSTGELYLVSRRGTVYRLRAT
jgi:hypothetical protein